MRKIIGLLALLMTIYSASARHITPEEAASIASEFINSKELRDVTLSSHSPMKASGVYSNAKSPYYFFNKGADQGFVIISGDDRAPKILGYSDKGSFNPDRIPPQLKAMMERWRSQIAEMPEGGDMHPSWNAGGLTRGEDEVLLATANWGQGFPYNAETPIADGVHCPTGCVATAMAIVMKYNKWPETYDWDSMPMEIEQTEDNPAAENPELARLMKDAGEAVFMNYNQWESGADMNWVGHRLQYIFHYSPECQFISSRYFPEEQWIGMIKENLDNGYPIIYSGSGTGSHAFVIDGYNSIGYHVNWGWDGWFNGYFVLDDLSPNESQSFSEFTGMVMNISPDKSGDVYS
ncbi:MAG: C10 family peptidase, partial [Muribaculaceae bacterium]|nr:C10 family peptidase [Muribaculaceae bacterium]